MFLTVVGCLEIKNAAFTNQFGEDTNLIRACRWMVLTLHRHYGQVRGRTAKWMLAFTKLACMESGEVLPLQRRCRQGGS